MSTNVMKKRLKTMESGDYADKVKRGEINIFNTVVFRAHAKNRMLTVTDKIIYFNDGIRNPLFIKHDLDLEIESVSSLGVANIESTRYINIFVCTYDGVFGVMMVFKAAENIVVKFFPFNVLKNIRKYQFISMNGGVLDVLVQYDDFKRELCSYNVKSGKLETLKPNDINFNTESEKLLDEYAKKHGLSDFELNKNAVIFPWSDPTKFLIRSKKSFFKVLSVDEVYVPKNSEAVISVKSEKIDIKDTLFLNGFVNIRNDEKDYNGL